MTPITLPLTVTMTSHHWQPPLQSSSQQSRQAPFSRPVVAKSQHQSVVSPLQRLHVFPEEFLTCLTPIRLLCQLLNHRTMGKKNLQGSARTSCRACSAALTYLNHRRQSPLYHSNRSSSSLRMSSTARNSTLQSFSPRCIYYTASRRDIRLARVLRVSGYSSLPS